MLKGEEPERNGRLVDGTQGQHRSEFCQGKLATVALGSASSCTTNHADFCSLLCFGLKFVPTLG